MSGYDDYNYQALKSKQRKTSVWLQKSRLKVIDDSELPKVEGVEKIKFGKFSYQRHTIIKDKTGFETKQRIYPNWLPW